MLQYLSIMKRILRSLAETKKSAKQFVKTLRPGDVVVLRGNLGAGKTTFTSAVAAVLGAKEVSSPTFALLQTYPTKHKTIQRIHHLDLYRLRRDEDLREVGIEEILSDPEAVVFIEWGERLGKYTPKKAINIYFEHHGKTQRKVTINRK